MNGKLTDRLKHLDTLKANDLKEMEDHYQRWSRKCGECDCCDFNYSLVQIYRFESEYHIQDRRKGDIHDRVESYLNKLNIHPTVYKK